MEGLQAGIYLKRYQKKQKLLSVGQVAMNYLEITTDTTMWKFYNSKLFSFNKKILEEGYCFNKHYNANDKSKYLKFV